VRDGRIAWIGRARGAGGGRVHDCGGMWLTPGLIDCHTHIVHAGNRSDEWEARLNGASYEDIARSGGGIMSTVRATRAGSEEELLRQSAPRIAALLAEGVTTLEIKSGYGLDLASEAKMLRVARRVGELLPVNVSTTFLGAHALPPEYAGRADDYIDEICERMLPALAQEGLADAVDAFCERIGFSHAQTARVFEAARRLGLPVKLHAEQLSDQGGAALVARFGGLSADHLEHLSEAGIAAMAAAGTVAVLLPGAYYFLRETRMPPLDAAARRRRAAGRRHRLQSRHLAHDLPAAGDEHGLHPVAPDAAGSAARLHRQRARALGRRDIGTLEAGKRADFALWDIARPADLAYAIGANPCREVFNAGVPRPPQAPLPRRSCEGRNPSF
jgi:imidazolonepropionase